MKIWWSACTEERAEWDKGGEPGTQLTQLSHRDSHLLQSLNIYIKGLRPLPPTPGREGELTHTSLPEPTRKLYGYESKYKVWIKAPKLHTIHTPRSILWSIPLIHTPDPYPFLVEERLMLALTMLFILIYTASGRRTATPIATTVASTAASTASAAAAAATTSDYPPRSCCYCSCWSCSRCWCWLTFSVCFGSWTNVTSWLATRNIASAPWRLVRPVLLPLGAYCTSSGAMTTTPSVSTLPGTCRTKKAWCPDPYPDPDPFHAWSISEPSHATTSANMKVRICYYFCCCFLRYLCFYFYFCLYFYFYFCCYYYYFYYYCCCCYYYYYSIRLFYCYYFDSY